MALREVTLVKEGFIKAVLMGQDTLVEYYMRDFPSVSFLETASKHRDVNGDSCLHVVVRNQHLKMADFLLSRGFDPNCQNNQGDTALHVAVRIHDEKSAELLCRFGADKKIDNHKHETALGIAAQAADAEVVRALRCEIGLKAKSPSTTTLNNMCSDVLSVSSVSSFSPNTCSPSMRSPLDYGRNKALASCYLDKVAKQKLDAHRVSVTNPFTLLRRDLSLQRETERVLAHLMEDSELPILAGWLQWKSSSFGGWKKRFVSVTDGHFRWCNHMHQVKRHATADDHVDGRVQVPLMNIRAVLRDKERIFRVVLKQGSMKQYVWRCGCPEDRDFWVNGILQHIAHAESMDRHTGLSSSRRNTLDLDRKSGPEAQ